MKRLLLMALFITVLLLILAACNNEENVSETESGDEEMTVTNTSPEDFPAAFLAGDFEQIYAQFSQDFQAQISLEEFEELGREFNQGVQRFEPTSEMTLLGMKEYQWTSESEDRGIRSYWSEDLTIEGLQVMYLQSFPDHNERYTENTYHMPIREEWFTFWGGTNELINYHYPLESQRYAYDLLIREGNASFEGDPEENESYYAFGKEVVAPLEGTVVAVENDIADNTPTVDTNTDEPLGNHVIIEHANNEYSFIAHFKQGSVVVSEGDEVEANELLGFAGNSGNSSEAHIHFHVGDSSDWEEATSIRIKFEDEREPVRGEAVSGF